MQKVLINKIDQLPPDIKNLSEPANTEGFRFIERLIEAFKSDDLPFSKTGEALFEVRDVNKILIGIGGITQDIFSRSDIGRLRRFYIHPQHRKFGIGSRLLNHIEDFAKSYFSQLNLYTDTPSASLFYEKNGYIYAMQDQQTHHKFLK